MFSWTCGAYCANITKHHISFCSLQETVSYYLRPFGRNREINRFHTDLREVLLYIKYSKEKEKLVDLIQTDDGFQNMKTETVVMLNTLTNSKLKFNEEKEETSMCLAIDELREEAKQEGIEFGRRELIEKMLMNHETMDKIKEYTGYTQEKIDEIAKELSAR